MIFRKNKKKKNVIVYSAGRDGSNVVFDSLNLCEQLSVRQVYTLDRERIEAFIARGGDIPQHVLDSKALLDDGFFDKNPCYFVTMVHEPFGRHVRQTFSQIQSRVDPSALSATLSNARSMVDYFYSVPTEISFYLCESEYFYGTGLNVYDYKFDISRGHIHIKAGAHNYLILSAHLPADKMTNVLMAFLETKIPPVLENTSPYDGLRDLLTTQVYNQDKQRVIDTFYDTKLIKHFFASDQKNAFIKNIEDTCERIQNARDDGDQLKTTTAREQLLSNAISQIYQVPHLTAEIGILINKRGTETIANVIDGVLKQLEKAQANLLLSGMRALAQHNNNKAIELGENWLKRQTDERAVKSLSAFYQRSSSIRRPLELISALPELDEKLTQDKANLAAQLKLLDKPFPFSQKAKTGFTPKEKSILYNPHQCLPYHTSGYATRTQGINKGLVKCGWNMNVFARAGYPRDTGFHPDSIMGTTNVDGVPYAFDMMDGRGQFSLPLDAYVDKAASYLVECADSIQPNIIHTASNYTCGLAGVEAARRLGLPSIFEMRGLWHITRWSKEPTYVDTDKFALAQKLELEAAANADHVLAITGALKEWLIDNGIDGNKISLAPNAVDLNQFAYLEPDTEFARMVGCEGKIVVGYIGSFVQYEGLDLLVEAVALLPQALRDKIKLLWIGDGVVLPDLLELAKKLGVSDNVISLGRRPFEEVPRAYSIVDISAFPRKGQIICEIVSPLKPFEAMAMHKAIIVSDVRPLKEIVTHGVTGLIHQKDNSQSLSDQLARFIEDADLRRTCGKNAREWVENTRQWDTIARSISDVYHQLLS